MSKVYLVEAKRTAIGSFLGSLKGVQPGDLGAHIVKAIIDETKINPAKLDEVVMGNVLHAGHKQGIGRQTSIKAGVPQEVPGYSINMICGSGLKSVYLAYCEIKCGQSNLILAGGVESMSQAGFVLPASARTGVKMGDLKLIDHMVSDGLTDAFHGYHMGITAENIVDKYNISREEQDAFAYESQRRAIKAVDSGRFDDEIVPIEVKVNRKETKMFARDEHPNRKSTLEKLAKLRPAFKKDGTVTAGNASGLNDGASAVLLASEEALKENNLTPKAEVFAVGQGGVDPAIMGMGPVAAIRDVLKKAKMSLKDIELFELNEAFASQSLGVLREVCEEHDVTKEWMLERTNVNGGAIALGHPVGCSGNRILVTLLYEMEKRDLTYGLATLCIGGGMSVAVILKRDK
ncbi:MAG: acetyl-CoA C-acetyltransferase [Fusobacterium sp. JB019]|nr:acetyl-CoA C-acetyltransferase [Fusobacterium sp. JB019]